MIFKHTKGMQAFRQQHFQTLFLDWLLIGHESVPGGQTAHSTAHDSNPRNSDGTDKEDRRMWPQITHGQFLSFH